MHGHSTFASVHTTAAIVVPLINLQSGNLSATSCDRVR